MSIGGARNAGLLAVRILASGGGDRSGTALAAHLAGFADGLEQMVLAKHDALREPDRSLTKRRRDARRADHLGTETGISGAVSPS